MNAMDFGDFTVRRAKESDAGALAGIDVIASAGDAERRANIARTVPPLRSAAGRTDASMTL
ncbi:hypothetical protein [Embleya scabrispora]|uniref:hypothetical protein n=1 Tax=Embleya scabrispora TaxID=159449 RepID=UPI00099CCDDA|nr:hypothetical protein [Embleya scabrispora]